MTTDATTTDDVARDPGERAVAAPPASERHRARSIVATVLGILAVIVLTVTVVAVWAKATVLRPEPVADLVGDAIAEPDVQQALAAYLAGAAAEAVDLEDKVVAALPGPLQRLAPSIAAGAEAAAESVLGRVLATPQFEQAVRTLVEAAHSRAMRLLEGDGVADGISVADGQVTLNTLPLMSAALTALQSATGLFSNVQVPQFAADGDPQQQIDQLSQATGRDLPDDFGQIVVYQSDSVSNAQESVQTGQRMLVLAKRAAWLLVILSVVLVAATILVAPRRLRAVLVLALGTLAASVLLRASLRTIVDQAPNLATGPGAKAAISSIVGGAAGSLQRLAGVMLLVAAVAAIVSVLVRRQWRDDLILAAAVVLGAITTAAIGVGSWGIIVGVLVGLAVPFAARWLLSLLDRRPGPPEVTETAATASGAA